MRSCAPSGERWSYRGKRFRRLRLDILFRQARCRRLPDETMLKDLFLIGARRNLVQAFKPRRTFRDVILPPATLRALEFALTQIEKHDLIFNQWGLSERHSTGLGLAFAFAGPPGTGKTICAEALASALGKKLLVVRYSELESMWVGETGKNVTEIFRSALNQNAVLFFDEADAIASRRFTSLNYGYEREANTVVNILLNELESFPGVVIFATNLAANFDPAFERRIRTHILFEMPGVAERELIWRVQLHDTKTPLAEDVDFRQLAQKYEVSGGDIKNAVLKAAQMATAEPGEDEGKAIYQRHFEAGIKEVKEARKIMEQSLFNPNGSEEASPLAMLHRELMEGQLRMREEIDELKKRLESLQGRSESGLRETRSAMEGVVEEMTRVIRRTAYLALASGLLCILVLLVLLWRLF
jgi:SpoVK/Ycf46/Vps4 family AAA+-type ATPase